ncbi:ROK family transcriptional regulator [Mumia sp. Pv 4-285]|uniref:ROK family transcriptional regulator n=1 Tax=Mumia qirimensis TaxID=3234852 RepID=UPI00351DA5DB
MIERTTDSGDARGTTPLRPRSSRRSTEKMLPADTRRHHLSLLLQCLADEGPLSRADLARATSLTRVTVSDLVTELLTDGLVAELGTKPGARPGKPATLLGLVDDAVLIVALDLSDDTVLHGALMDLRGEIVTRHAVELGTARGEAAVDLVVALVQRLVDVSERPVLGVGIGTPGVVDELGVVRQAPNLGWYELPLAAAVGERVGLPVSISNDANIAALAECTFGAGNPDGLLLVAVGHGVGGGILMDGAMLGGPLLSAGEVGHVVVDPGGAPCACGNRGCLETVLAVPRLRDRLAAVAPDAVESELRTVGTTLGAVLAPIVTTLGITDVVLYGPAELLDGPLLGAVRAAVAERSMPVIAENLDVRMASLASDVVLTGAAAQVRFAQLGVV